MIKNYETLQFKNYIDQIFVYEKGTFLHICIGITETYIAFTCTYVP